MVLTCPGQPKPLPVYLEYRKSLKGNGYIVLIDLNS